MASTPNVVHNRFIGFLIWQSIISSSIFILFRFLTNFSLPSQFNLLPFLEFSFSLALFNLSILCFSFSLSISSVSHPSRHASFLDLTFGLVRMLLVSGDSSIHFRRRVRVSLRLVIFVASCAVSGIISVVFLCGWLGFSDDFGGKAGLIGFIQGLVYGGYYVFNGRWVLEYPIIQRPLYFSFKMGIPQAAQQALKLSSVAYLVSVFLVILLPDQFKSRATIGEFTMKLFLVYIGSFSVSFCWELVHQLYRVLNTKRFAFAPPQGSAAAETNPSEHLISALEESTPRSLLQYLAYLDLCMVCENNVDTWRRAAFFEESGETYKRVMTSCLKPLEQFVSKLAEGLESCIDTKSQLSHQLRSPSDPRLESQFHEIFNDFMLCAWCSQAASSLTAHSHKEDRFGVAQLSGSNASVISILLSCLLAIETLMGKRTNLQSQNQLFGPAGIKWAALNTGKKEPTVSFIGTKKKGGPLHAKAYAMADIIRTSIYCVVYAFHDEMQSSKAELMEKDWIVSGKPLYGTRELLVQKLRLFLDSQAC